LIVHKSGAKFKLNDDARRGGTTRERIASASYKSISQIEEEAMARAIIRVSRSSICFGFEY
jgi:hypothetical protein